MTRRSLLVTSLWAGLSTAALGALGWYLRDPPWLSTLESGFRAPETLPDGTTARWIGGHASFFVPSTAATIMIPLRTTFESLDDPPITVTIAVDDRPADRVTLLDDTWHHRRLTMPVPAGRRVRRIDVRADRVRAGNRGVQLGVVVSR